jgi:hypothetical protein
VASGPAIWFGIIRSVEMRRLLGSEARGRASEF